MATAVRYHAAAALRRGFLLLGLLAVVAGFLGMHIMTGMHGAHVMSAVAASADPAGVSSLPADGLASRPAAHALHAGTAVPDFMAPAPASSSGPEPSDNSRTAALPASCMCQSGCTDLASMHSTCVPSAAVNSLAAHPPGMAPASLQTPDMRGDGAGRAYAYLPASPSPGDLSISRT